MASIRGNPARPLPAEAFLLEETYARTRLPVSLASTLIPDAYTSEDFFRLERERVFGTSWVVVGCASQLEQPGDTLVTDIGGQSLIVTRSPSGELNAFHNVCRHPAPVCSTRAAASCSATSSAHTTAGRTTSTAPAWERRSSRRAWRSPPTSAASSTWRT
jgi:hypothetical protein